jgi:hypothetical protein
MVLNAKSTAINDSTDPADDVEDAHEGDEPGRDLADAGDAADDDDADERREDQAEDNGSALARHERQDFRDLGKRLIGLVHVATAEAAADSAWKWEISRVRPGGGTGIIKN